MGGHDHRWNHRCGDCAGGWVLGAGDWDIGFYSRAAPYDNATHDSATCHSAAYDNATCNNHTYNHAYNAGQSAANIARSSIAFTNAAAEPSRGHHPVQWSAAW